MAFDDIEVYPQVTADATKAAYVRLSTASIRGTIYSIQGGALLGSIPWQVDGTLALSPDSVSAFGNAIEGSRST